MYVKKKDVNSAEKKCSECSSDIKGTYIEILDACFCGKCFKRTVAEYFFSEDTNGLVQKKNKLTEARELLRSIAGSINEKAILEIIGAINDEIVEIKDDFNDNILSDIENYLMEYKE